ncbi:monovalent cation/H+ antiporter complex subunit F [Kitasatospora sp. NPDC056138]|uniref:monovalent cation/H+ antiporter complex subunit F n=1 Tax=Kitasatospora sp. NPDC056138 TaxID=3345724 RepID=UPI0035DBB9DF
MSAWSAAVLVLLTGTVPPCLWQVARGRTVCRLAAVALLGSVAGAVFLVLPEGFERPAYQDLALVLAALSPAGTLVFTRFVCGEGHEEEGGTEPGRNGLPDR